MKIKQFDIWLANLNPQRGTEPGKTRPVVIIQANALNAAGHHSTIICPISTNVIPNFQILRININPETAGIKQDSDIILDQIRAIDNKRLLKKLGNLPPSITDEIKQNLLIICGLE